MSGEGYNCNCCTYVAKRREIRGLVFVTSKRAVHCQRLLPCKADFKAGHLLLVLIREFGGQARCVDLAEELLPQTSIAHIEDNCILCVRNLLKQHETLGLVTTQPIGEGVLLVDITPQGVTDAFTFPDWDF